MSVLTRLAAPAAASALAAVAYEALSEKPTAAAELITPSPAAEPAPAEPRPVLLGPTGLGTSATRIGRTAARPRPRPALYCPPALRDRPELGEEVNLRLVEWAKEIGIYPGQLDTVRKANFGRLMMLAHPDGEDPERLLAAAKCALAEWSVDDHYVDGTADETDPRLLGQRLAVAYTAIDAAHLPQRYAPELAQVADSDPVMVALRSSLADLGRYATPAQVARLRHELAVMFVAYNQEGVWRATGQRPPVWEYLMHRHENSFVPCMALVDMVGGYELPAPEFADSRVRRVFNLAGTAAVIVNDLYSMSREDPSDTNLPTVIAAEEGCTPAEAVDRTVEIHNELVHAFESEAAALAAAGSPALHRFLTGLWAWMGGGREWHASSPRYHDSPQQL